MSAEELGRLMTTLLTGRAPGGENAGRKKPEVKLPYFTSALSQDWRDWKKLADNAKSTNQWTDEEAKRMVFSKCSGEAGKRVRLVPLGGDPDLVPRPADAKDYRTYMEELQVRFQPKTASSLAFNDFVKCTQRPDEDYQGYHTRLEGLYCLAEPDENPQTSKLLIRMFITGLKDKIIADHLMDQKPTTYSSALDLAQEKMGNLYLIRQGKVAGSKPATSFINAVGPVDCEDAEEYADMMVNAINYPTGARAVSTRSANKNLRRFGPDYANKLQPGAGCERGGGSHSTNWCPQATWGKGVENNRRVQFHDAPRYQPNQRQRGRGRNVNPNRGRGRRNGQKGGRSVSALSDHTHHNDDVYDESLAALQSCIRSAMKEGN